eukprot:757295-Hanusia_phi.AAC.1
MPNHNDGLKPRKALLARPAQLAAYARSAHLWDPAGDARLRTLDFIVQEPQEQLAVLLRTGDPGLLLIQAHLAIGSSHDYEQYKPLSSRCKVAHKHTQRNQAVESNR